MAAEIARRYGAKIVLLSALADSTATSADPAVDTVELEWASSPAARVRRALERTESQLRREGLECRTLVDEGDPGEVLVRLAEECGADRRNSSSLQP